MWKHVEQHSPIALASREHALEKGASVLVIHQVMQGPDIVWGQQGISQGVEQVRVGGVRGGCWLAWQQTHLACQGAPFGLLRASKTSLLD